MMNTWKMSLQPIFMGVLRHVLTIAAGFIVARGWLDADSAQSLLGALIALIGVFWSAQDKQTRPPSLLASAASPTPAPTPILLQAPTATLPTRLDESGEPTASPVFNPTRPIKPPVAQTSLSQESGFVLSERSLTNLKGVHPKLVAVVELALRLTSMDFVVIEGLRSEARQKELLAQGRSWVQRSAHQEGKAVDLMALPADGSGNWEATHYDLINAAMQEAAGRLGVRLTWGGQWKVRDLVDFQIEGV